MSYGIHAAFMALASAKLLISTVGDAVSKEWCNQVDLFKVKTTQNTL